MHMPAEGNVVCPAARRESEGLALVQAAWVAAASRAALQAAFHCTTAWRYTLLFARLGGVRGGGRREAFSPEVLL